MRGIHGGDIYRNRVSEDFSVNVNPMGMPDGVRTALEKAVERCGAYPDPEAEQLKGAVSRMLGVPEKYLLFGNGASELFLGILHAVRPRRTLIPVPSFYGYEYAAEAAGGEITYFPLSPESGYLPGDDLLETLTEDVDLLFLANPNNPTGRLAGKEYLKRLLEVCGEKGILAVIDECFIEFCGGDEALLSELEVHRNLLLVRAFTKSFALPGVRLGYLLCSDLSLLESVRKQLPEWNLSVFAQAAGVACTGERGFLEKTVSYVRTEREFLTESLKKLGVKVFPGEADFILAYSDRNLYEELLEQGILIRDCSNFRGLSKGFFRIAVKTRQENEMLLEALTRTAPGEVPVRGSGREKAEDLGHLVPEEISERESGREKAEDLGHLVPEEISVRESGGEKAKDLGHLVPGKIPERESGREQTENLVHLRPEEIERRSFEIIGQELEKRGILLPKEQERITKRVIHTTADFEYTRTLCYSENAVETIQNLIRNGADIVTDTNMALSGINRKILAGFGGEVHCFMAEEETARLAKARGTTRAAVSMELAAGIKKPVIFAIGNAPTALIQLYEMVRDGVFRPAFIIGVPVGFVNVEAAKELILKTDIPYIINRGRKGGSGVAAAICNAVLYELSPR